MGSNIIQFLDPIQSSKNFYGLYGLFDGIDVSISSYNYFCTIMEWLKENEGHFYHNLIKEQEQFLTIGFLSLTTGLSVLSHYLETGKVKEEKSKTKPLLSDFWNNYRYLLLSMKNAVKTHTCVSPMLNTLYKNKTIDPIIILSLYGMSIFARTFHMSRFEQLDLDIANNNHLIKELKTWNQKSEQPASNETYEDILKKIEKSEDYNKIHLTISAMLAGIIDKPLAFYPIFTSTVLSPHALVLVSGFFALYTIGSIINNVYVTHKNLNELRNKQLECESLLSQMNKVNDAIDNIPRRKTASSVLDNLYLTHLFNGLNSIINIIDVLPLANIAYGAQLVMAVSIPGVYLAASTIVPLLIAGSLYKLVSEFNNEALKKDIIASALTIHTGILSYFKGIRLAKFTEQRIGHFEKPYFNFCLRFLFMSIISLESLVRNFNPLSEKNNIEIEKKKNTPDLSHSLSQSHFSFWGKNPEDNPEEKANTLQPI